ncbi:hypothetical protein A2U01_0059739 [Trifolium medium]|uniref:Uncharacterized protein n=1 Tax=Trifolium medium TaxID=97028 RepID=A0A392RPE2_9FABA|nr:hypothetical protein [Trifolium medium]
MPNWAKKKFHFRRFGTAASDRHKFPTTADRRKRKFQQPDGYNFRRKKAAAKDSPQITGGFGKKKTSATVCNTLPSDGWKTAAKTPFRPLLAAANAGNSCSV